MSIPALLIEAFTDTPCRGNGAAVVLLPSPVSDAWMQGLAQSLNQSETAFLLACEQGWMLRWFTPSCEVPLCGHATLAALLALRHWDRLPSDMATVFHSRSGPLTAAMRGAFGTIALPTGTLFPDAAPPYLSALLLDQLGAAVEAFWRSSLGYSVALLPASAQLPDLTLEARALAPQESGGLVLMQPLEEGSNRPLVASMPADYQLRFFAPGLGIPEDPVTGSAHTLVAPYWMDSLGRDTVVGWQCSSRSGGMLCERASSGMIRLSGAGSVLWQGQVLMQPDSCDGAAESWRQIGAGG